MPLLHWYCYSFLEQIFNCFADFATDFGNGNIMTKAHPITKLNMSALKSVLTVLKTFCSQINLHQATMTAITVMPGSIAAYTLHPWNNTQASRPTKDEKNSLADGASRLSSNTTFTPEQLNGGKSDPTTPDTNEDIPSSHQRQKKPCRGVKVDTATKEEQDLGMFYLHNLSINPADNFPKDMPKKLCANFTCKARANHLDRQSFHQERLGMVQPIPFHKDAQHHRWCKEASWKHKRSYQHGPSLSTKSGLSTLHGSSIF
jgi:hypothetical protein